MLHHFRSELARCEVLFSAAAQDGKTGDEAYADLMIFGTKCLLVIAVPLCIGLYILAPTVVHVWLSVARPETARVMQITSIGVIADAMRVGPLHVLWGRGHAVRVLVITAGVTASILLLNFVLIPLFGAPGSALAFAVSAWVGAIVTTIHAAHETHSSWINFLISSFSEVTLPSVSLAVFTVILSAAMPGYPRTMIGTAVVGGGILYVILYWRLWSIRSGSTCPSQFWFKRIFKGS